MTIQTEVERKEHHAISHTEHRSFNVFNSLERIADEEKQNLFVQLRWKIVNNNLLAKQQPDEGARKIIGKL